LAPMLVIAVAVVLALVATDLHDLANRRRG
jgi:hypothetical protein